MTEKGGGSTLSGPQAHAESTSEFLHLKGLKWGIYAPTHLPLGSPLYSARLHLRPSEPRPWEKA